MKAFILNLCVSFLAMVVQLGNLSGGLGLGEDFWLLLAITFIGTPVLLLVGSILAIIGLCRRQEPWWNLGALLLAASVPVYYWLYC